MDIMPCLRGKPATIREDTILINYPLYCPKCRQERLIEVKNLHVTVVGNEWKNDI